MRRCFCGISFVLKHVDVRCIALRWVFTHLYTTTTWLTYVSSGVCFSSLHSFEGLFFSFVFCLNYFNYLSLSCLTFFLLFSFCFYPLIVHQFKYLSWNYTVHVNSDRETCFRRCELCDLLRSSQQLQRSPTHRVSTQHKFGELFCVWTLGFRDDCRTLHVLRTPQASRGFPCTWPWRRWRGKSNDDFGPGS